MQIKIVILAFLSLVSFHAVQACPWAIGRSNGYLALNYSLSDYNRLYVNDRQTFVDAQKVTNEAYDLYYSYGLNHRDTLIVTTRYSNIGAYTPVPGPKVAQISDTYLGFKRTYRSGMISVAWELGVLSAGDYAANLSTSPGYGETEFNLAWHWAKIFNSGEIFNFSARYRKRNNLAPNAAQLMFEHSRRISDLYRGRVLVFYDEQFSSININDIGSGWVDYSFHRKDESQLIAGIGLSRKLTSNMNLDLMVSHKFDGRNTDAADRNISIGIGISF